MTGKTGSLLYMAPEGLASQPYNSSRRVLGEDSCTNNHFSLSLSLCLSLSLPLWLTPNSSLALHFC